jgi:Phosphotransferase enzyme family
VETDPEAIRLPGGNVAPVYRVGDTVRRAAGPWTPAVHALLIHLERIGFEGAPRALGIDGEGREILSYIDGFVPYAPHVPGEIWSDGALAATARLVRDYHDAVRSFAPPADAQWRHCPGAPTFGEIVCHNDIGPWNTVYRGRVPVSFIDWDFAAPAPALWDIAYAAWRFVPLYHDGLPGSADRADAEDCAWRLRLFCDAYGLDDRSRLLDVIQDRQQVMYDTVRIWGEADVPGFAEMWKTGHASAPLLDRAFVTASRDILAASL